MNVKVQNKLVYFYGSLCTQRLVPETTEINTECLLTWTLCLVVVLSGWLLC